MVPDPEEEVLKVGHLQITWQAVADQIPKQPDWRQVQSRFEIVLGLQLVLAPAVVEGPSKNEPSSKSVGRRSVVDHGGRSVANFPVVLLHPHA